MHASASTKPAATETAHGLQKDDRLERLIGSAAKPSTHLSQGDVYRASPIKRQRATNAAVEERRLAIYDIVADMQPMTVRQVFYQATVKGVVEKTEAAYTKVQVDLTLMRRSGDLPYGWLTDSTRVQRRPRTFDGVDAALDIIAADGGVR
jgi:hypothetical protein